MTYIFYLRFINSKYNANDFTPITYMCWSALKWKCFWMRSTINATNALKLDVVMLRVSFEDNTGLNHDVSSLSCLVKFKKQQKSLEPNTISVFNSISDVVGAGNH